MTADVSLPICTDAWMPAVVSYPLFVLLLSFSAHKHSPAAGRKLLTATHRGQTWGQIVRGKKPIPKADA